MNHAGRRTSGPEYDFRTAFGAQIRRLRLARALKQSTVAGLVGVSREAVSFWECGLGFPAPWHLLVLAKLLGTTADALLEYATEHRGERAVRCQVGRKPRVLEAAE